MCDGERLRHAGERFGGWVVTAEGKVSSHVHVRECE